MTHENKFGMFIHWGLYAVTELQDQALFRYQMDHDEYNALIHKFNPTEYDPEKWVLLAKSAGMKYICFTAKHHEGFCMWDTKYTDFNIMNTPYGRDVLKMLAEACEKHGMLLSLYYSNPDWHHEYGYNPWSTHQWGAIRNQKHDIEKYKEFVKNQVTELLTNYGKIYTFFWDIPPRLKDPSLNELVRRLQPGILINDRGWDVGDFSTPEREYRPMGSGRFTRMTEACNSVDEQSWGYRREADFYSIKHLTTSISKIMSNGGNYLLNVGPTPLGTIADNYVDRIKKVGDWYNRMQGCLECHEEDTFEYGIFKNNDYVVTKKNGKSYFHFPEGTKSTAIAMLYYPGLPKKVTVVNTGKELNAKIETLPEFFDFYTGFGRTFLHITGVPVDELAAEPVVIEIEW